MTRDAQILLGSAFVRSSAVGLTSVLAAIALRERGFTLSQIGIVLAVGLAGGGAATALISARGDALGRRVMLIALSLLTAVGYVSLARTSVFPALLALAFVGMVNGMGRDRGPAPALEQAILPETTAPERHTWLYAWYNVLLDLGQTAGAAGAVLAVSASKMFVGCAVASLTVAVAYTRLSPRIETPAAPGGRPAATRQTRSILRTLAVLFALDSFGSGFLNSALLAYWFFERYGLSQGRVALLFAAARALNAVSHLGAAWLARRIGLLNTMVATHLPSSVLLMLAPLSPAAGGAVTLFLAREALVEMDVPTRQSYVMAIVPPEDRTLVSGVTSVVRLLGWAAGPAVAGLLMQHVAPAAPLFVGGALKIVYDLLLYRAFRHVAAPEETVRP